MLLLPPRIVVAGTHSGVGKTTIATGLMAALASRGLRVASAKVGPDFIDPGYHRLATGRPGCTLDAFLSGEGLLAGLAGASSAGADILVVEGVMGLFDGSAQPGCDGSTAAVAKLLGAPVLLVVDASAMSGSVAALVHGFRSYDPDLCFAGVVLNKVGSAGHLALLEEALASLGVPILGHLGIDDRFSWRERSLGLVPVAERPAELQASLGHLGAAVGDRIDLAALVAIAQGASRLGAPDPPRAAPVLPGGRPPRIALCAGPAFSFVYPENIALFEQAGAEVVRFDPLVDEALPEGSAALYAGGGFPELFAAQLGANLRLLAEVSSQVRDGLVTWAECGGYVWLTGSLDGTRMAGVLGSAQATMTDRLAIGYRSARALVASCLGPAGTALKGHEFHRAQVEPAGEALELTGRAGSEVAGYASPSLFASFLHQHLSASPELAQAFVAAAASRARGVVPGRFEAPG